MRPYNQTLLCDFYELTMGNGYLLSGKKDMQACFDLYFRKVPDNGGYAIAAGLSEMIEFLEQLHFDKEDIDYLRSKNQFSEEFLQYLAVVNIACGIDAMQGC